MKTFTVKKYDAVIRMEDGEEYAVDLGVVESGVPFEAYWESWIDPRIYFNLTAKELDELQVGDELAEGDILVEIDKECHSILEAEYDPEEYEEQEAF